MCEMRLCESVCVCVCDFEVSGVRVQDTAAAVLIGRSEELVGWAACCDGNNPFLLLLWRQACNTPRQ